MVVGSNAWIHPEMMGVPDPVRPARRFTLDISRLLSRRGEPAPTGIDRVELAYARYLVAFEPDMTNFVALHPLGRFGLLPFAAAARFIGLLFARWSAIGGDDGQAARAGRWLLHGLMLPQMANGPPSLSHSVYLLLSHHHLTRPAVIAEALARRKIAAFVPMIHDLVPIEFPEYARPHESAKHLQRIETVVRYADGVLVPSDSVRKSLLPRFEAAGRAHVPIRVVPHGVHECDAPPRTSSPTPPYFVCIGTIEPRKNHLMLLNLWRRLVEKHGGRTPKLCLIGRRGWENENIIDMIERCPTLQGVVEEHNSLADGDVRRLLIGSRALLFPSFEEGYGLPLAEALSLGTPVICSDIPVFREVAGDVPVYLDPLDGLGWLHMVEVFTCNNASARENQRCRLVNQPISTWRDSVNMGVNFAASLLPNSETFLVGDGLPQSVTTSSTARKMLHHI